MEEKGTWYKKNAEVEQIVRKKPNKKRNRTKKNRTRKIKTVELNQTKKTAEGSQVKENCWNKKEKPDSLFKILDKKFGKYGTEEVGSALKKAIESPYGTTCEINQMHQYALELQKQEKIPGGLNSEMAFVAAFSIKQQICSNEICCKEFNDGEMIHKPEECPFRCCDFCGDNVNHYTEKCTHLCRRALCLAEYRSDPHDKEKCPRNDPCSFCNKRGHEAEECLENTKRTCSIQEDTDLIEYLTKIGTLIGCPNWVFDRIDKYMGPKATKISLFTKI